MRARVSEDIYRERIGFLYLNRPSLFSFVVSSQSFGRAFGKDDSYDDGFDSHDDDVFFFFDVRFPGRFRVRLVLRAKSVWGGVHSNSTTRTTSFV